MKNGLHDALGVSAYDLDVAQARMRRLFPAVDAADRTVASLGDVTGIPTYHDLYKAARTAHAWLGGEDEETTLERREPPPVDEEGDEDDGVSPWLMLLGAAAAGYYLYKKLDHRFEHSQEVGFDIPGFEFDGIPWTLERTRIPGPPFAARVNDPLLHGGVAGPGPGSPDVNISGRPALTVRDIVGACPGPHVAGMPHLPRPGGWKTSNGSVNVNGVPLLRAGDWIEEDFGGPNPVIAGAPLVLAGPPAPPCVVQEASFVGLDEVLPGVPVVGLEGGRVTLEGSASWSLRSMLGAMAAGALVSIPNPLAIAAGRAVMSQTDGPKIGLNASVVLEAFADIHLPLDPDDDGEIEHLLEGRARGTVKGSVEKEVEVDPANPGRAKGTSLPAPEFEFEPDFSEITLKRVPMSKESQR